jgi:hypothetical protein
MNDRTGMLDAPVFWSAPGEWRKSVGAGTDDWWSRRAPVDRRKTLAPVLDQLRRLDALRLKLEREGGTVKDLAAVTRLLNETLRVDGHFGASACCLRDQRALRTALLDVDYDLHHDVRQLAHRLPVYYICRTRRDFWGEYSLVVEDFHQSPGYAIADERFVRLMDVGHDVYFLRLAHLRDAARAMLGDGSADGLAVDALLYELGRHVFQAAWHEDQRLGILVAGHFHLPAFRRAIELLYLCLSGELCELRHAITPEMLRFFVEAYEQPAIYRFLLRLRDLDGTMITDLPRQGRVLYKRLGLAFSRCLGVEVLWGFGRRMTPLWKIVYGNLTRLDQVSRQLRLEPKVAGACGRLEQEAEAVIEELAGGGSSSQ